MPSKVQFYAQMANHVATQITGSYQSWISFLETAGRLYKYPYAEQLMIHAQRPDATACAEFDFWNQQWGRYVRRGSKGIALIDTSGDNPRLRYVFDVSDTGTRENSRAVRLWQLREEHHDSISAMLERTYDVSGENGLREQLERVAAQLADEYWNANQRDILDNIADSFLEEYDDFNVGVQFRNAATVSMTYSFAILSLPRFSRRVPAHFTEISTVNSANSLFVLELDTIPWYTHPVGVNCTTSCCIARTIFSFV